MITGFSTIQMCGQPGFYYVNTSSDVFFLAEMWCSTTGRSPGVRLQKQVAGWWFGT